MTRPSTNPDSGTGRTSAHCSPSSQPAAWPSTRRSACSPSRSWIFWLATSPPPLSPPPGQHPGHFILTIINLHNVCVYAAHFPAEIFNSRCCENLGIRPELNIFPWRKGRVYMEHIHQFRSHPIFYSTPNFCLRAAFKFKIKCVYRKQ